MPTVASEASLLVNLRAGDVDFLAPLYCVHPAGGPVFACAALLPHLNAKQSVIGISEYGWGDATHRLESVEDYAVLYADEVERHRGDGPIVLAGYSLGGLIVYEMARILTERGRDVPILLLLDAATVATTTAGADPRESCRSKLARRVARDGVRGIGGIVQRTAARQPGNHAADGSMLTPPHVSTLGQCIAEALADLARDTTATKSGHRRKARDKDAA